MPIIYRFLLSEYLKVLILSVVTFIIILLTTRLEDIAHFASLGAEGWHVLVFVLYQIPYILPIAIPIACLISSILLVQRLSSTHELTALRSCGMALRDFVSPLLFAGAIIALCNIYIVSEMATESHLSSGLLKEQLRSVNPLFMLYNKQLMKMKGFYIETLGASKVGESASKVVLAMPNNTNERINIMIASHLQAAPERFIGKGLTLISSMASPSPEGFDNLVVENINHWDTTVEDFVQMIQKKSWKVSNDHLKMSLLLAKITQDKKTKNKRELARDYTEIIRRVSVGFSAFTFTLMGAAFGVSISRNRSNKGIIFAVLLAALYLSAYFIAKGIDHHFIASSLIYTIPQILMIFMSVWMLSRASRGIE